MHFRHSAVLAKIFIDAGTHFQYKVSEMAIDEGKLIESCVFKVYPDVDHDLTKNQKLRADYFLFQRHFFQECLGGRVNKERKPIIPDEYD